MMHGQRNVKLLHNCVSMHNVCYFCPILTRFAFFYRVWQNYSTQNCTKILTGRSKLLHKNGRTDKHYNDNSHFRNIAKEPKNDMCALSFFSPSPSKKKLLFSITILTTRNFKHGGHERVKKIYNCGY